MECINSKFKEKIRPYAFGLLPEDEKTAVEAHLLECEFCFKRLYKISPAIEILEEIPERFLSAVELQESSLKRCILWFVNIFKVLKQKTTSLSSWFHEGDQKYKLKFVVPTVGVAVIALIFIISSQPNDFSDLAIFDKYPYKLPEFKGFETLSSSQQLFLDGIIFYRHNQYKKAIQKFREYISQETPNAYVHFYTGISYVMIDSVQSGIDHLKLAVEIGRIQKLKKHSDTFLWYLGNGYLKADNAEDALDVFQRIIQENGKFTERAKKQIQKIIKLRKNKGLKIQ